MKSVVKTHFPQSEAETKKVLATQDDVRTFVPLRPPPGARRWSRFRSFRARAWPVSLVFLFSPVLRPGWPCHREIALTQTSGSHPAAARRGGGLKVTGELRQGPDQSATPM